MQKFSKNTFWNCHIIWSSKICITPLSYLFFCKPLQGHCVCVFSGHCLVTFFKHICFIIFLTWPIDDTTKASLDFNYALFIFVSTLIIIWLGAKPETCHRKYLFLNYCIEGSNKKVFKNDKYNHFRLSLKKSHVIYHTT